MADQEAHNISIPTNVLVDILLRLRPSDRRRYRLVCQQWRDAVDTRTTEMQSRAKPLINTKGSAYVIDDLYSSADQGPTMSQLWASDDRVDTRLVGTCNGLICLCHGDIRKPGGGAIALANHLTGETLHVPPLPEGAHRTYCFAYHPTTGRYNVVHVPCRLDRVWVFVLGEPSWRYAVTAHPSAKCDYEAGIVSVDGSVYWATCGKEGNEVKIMSIDLEDELVRTIPGLPTVLSEPSSWTLAEVRGKLGLVFIHEESPTVDETEVWVMEGVVRGQHSWSKWYNMQTHKPQQPWPFQLHHQQFTRPNFALDGKHSILTTKLVCDSNEKIGYVFHKHMPSDDPQKAQRGVVEIDESNEGMVVANVETRNVAWCRTFIYVETTEPLSVYQCW
ncbi:hypothetical protein BRADI_4g11071v3 [Brachypodium distachyon]|uniref:F-box domain-containing protein n=1 Tax=Brachypodium distachyon TaxID=15368 RepID=A0A0Q3EI58_BRADI|nr:hypothetical protein BRADI_4g11071v3 [Brachypodium distachyon]